MSSIVFIHPQNNLKDMLIYSSVLRKIREETSETINIIYFILKKNEEHLQYLIPDLKNIDFVKVDSLHPNSMKLFMMFSRLYNSATKLCYGENDTFRSDAYNNAHLSMSHEYDLSVYDISDEIIFEKFKYFPKVSKKNHALFIKKFTHSINIVSSLKHLKEMGLNNSGILIDFGKMFAKEDVSFHDCYDLLCKTNSVQSYGGNSLLSIFVMLLTYTNQLKISKVILFPENETNILYSEIWNKIK
tara:strand:- start:10956 stop:11687 length:732 start_codon:yes stop_codon:yes gene_type:complete